VAGAPPVEALPTRLFGHLHADAESLSVLPSRLLVRNDRSGVWQYLSPVLTTLWYEDEDGDLLHNDPGYRDRWEDFAALLIDRQKHCIAHCLVGILKSAFNRRLCGSAYGNGSNRAHAEKYWNAWL
jgi:hypothetical protein